MIELAVCRNNSIVGECSEDDISLNWGPDISDPLLTTLPAGEERGRVEIDSVYSNRKNVNLKLPYETWRQPGILVGIDDGGGTVNGLLKNISLTYSISDLSIQVGSQLSIEREV